MSRETESVIKHSQTNKIPVSNGFTGKFYWTFKKLMPFLFKTFQRNRRGGNTSNSFYKGGYYLYIKARDKYYQKKKEKKTIGQYTVWM